MDTVAVITIVFVIAVVILLVIFRNRKKVSASVKGPGGVGMSFTAEDEAPTAKGGAAMEGVTAGRDATVEDKTGDGASMKQVEAGRDARASSGNPSQAEARPKE